MSTVARADILKRGGIYENAWSLMEK